MLSSSLYIDDLGRDPNLAGGAVISVGQCSYNLPPQATLVSDQCSNSYVLGCSILVDFQSATPGTFELEASCPATLYVQCQVSEVLPDGFIIYSCQSVPSCSESDPLCHILPRNFDTIDCYTVRGCQHRLAVSFSSPDVYPQNTDGDNTVTVKATLNCDNLTQPSPSDLAGKIIQFSSSPKDLSGGHSHSGGRPTGTFSPMTCTTDSNGNCNVTYSASEVGGVETITGVLTDDPSAIGQMDLNVKVPGLFEVADGSPFYRLTGQTPAHPSNNFITDQASGIFSVVNDFYDEFNAVLGLNDMSLQSGGLFDLGPPKGEFWSEPHDLHREGKSVDIDRCALSTIESNPNDQGTCPDGWIAILRKELNQICKDWGAQMVNEPSYHCEF